MCTDRDRESRLIKVRQARLICVRAEMKKLSEANLCTDRAREETLIFVRSVLEK